MYKILRLNEYNSFKENGENCLVRIYGISKENDKKAKINKDGNGFVDYQNLEEAKKDFSELDPHNGSTKFTKSYSAPGLQGYLVFSTWKHFKHNKFA